MTSGSSQHLEKLIADLSDPVAYSHPVQAVQVLQTHISCVFLTGDLAYKIKKPVDFGFLDYRDLDERRILCQEEIDLNRRLCPDLYLEMVPITLTDGRFCVGGSSPVVEWAVQMRQLRDQDMLPARLEARTIDSAAIESIAQILADFHTRAGTSPDIQEWGMHAVISHTIFNVLQRMEKLSANNISRQSLTNVRDYLKSFLRSRRDLFCRRAGAGCVRDCHGDLRTQNICLDSRFDGGVQIFDCIEFNQEFRYIDVAADLAYLAMDLDLAGRADLRKVLIDTYALVRPDRTLNQILPFYQTFRACVRGNIALMLAAEPEVPSSQRERHRSIAAASYDLARCYARNSAGPALLITSGFSGSGKSSLARELSRRLPAVLLSSDQIRKERAGVAATDRLSDAYYRSAERAEVYAELYRRAGKYLGRKEHVLLDATFLSPRERQAAGELAGQNGAEFWMLECRCPDAEIRRRLKLRQLHEHHSDAGTDIYDRQLQSYIPIEPPSGSVLVDQHHIVVDTQAQPERAATNVVDRFATL